MSIRMASFSWVNENAARQFGLPAEQIVGKSMFDLLPEDSARKYVELNQSLIDLGGSRTYEDTFVMQGVEKDVSYC